jgi:type I restriction enzyme R subunit
VQAHYAGLDDFLRHWSAAARKQAVIDELREQGVPLDELRAQVGRDLAPLTSFAMSSTTGHR